MVTTQDIAQEVVRTLVGSIGLVAAVPVTTAIAAIVARRDDIDLVQQPANQCRDPDVMGAGQQNRRRPPR
jgi:hypothetical protein